MIGSVESVAKHLIKRNNQNMNISFPAIVVNTDNISDGFVDVKPIVNYMNSATGDTIEYPVMKRVRVLYPSTKNTTICFPLSQGDFVDLLFQSVDIEDFVNGSSKPHDPFSSGYGNLKNVVAIVGFTPYQESCFNPDNYKNEFNNQDLNIVHNKNSDNEAIVSINQDGDISLKSPTRVLVESPSVEVNADTIQANNAVISTQGDVEIDGRSVKKFMDTHTHTGNLGSPTSPPTPTPSI